MSLVPAFPFSKPFNTECFSFYSVLHRGEKVIIHLPSTWYNGAESQPANKNQIRENTTQLNLYIPHILISHRLLWMVWSPSTDGLCVFKIPWNLLWYIYIYRHIGIVYWVFDGSMCHGKKVCLEEVLWIKTESKFWSHLCHALHIYVKTWFCLFPCNLNLNRSICTILSPLLTTFNNAFIGHSFDSMEICDSRNNINMCPLCDQACSYWKLVTACGTARASHLFDNPATVFFSIFMALWGMDAFVVVVTNTS